ncbi:MAG: peptide-methionine (S)-S-oxide reductase MsrA [Gemmatimonadales bacterium]|nr:MAG: peptide-methionine (S)-S-oxide reductase MsrA [Gemmatimonadales bacterium]
MTELATLGGGCFWCLEPIFRDLRGVQDVAVGYAGGQTENPTYQQVCHTDTGHAEVVQVTFNPDEISFRDLVDVFFAVHDPTTLNRQGADVGSQYRSIILAHDGDQACAAADAAEAVDASGEWENPVVTQVVPLRSFYRAEVEHQEYYAHNPNDRYCRIVADPKIAKFRKRFGAMRKEPSPVD